MNRIVVIRQDGMLCANGLTIKDIPGPLCGAIRKLHEYEKIGKSPEDIEMVLNFYDQKCEEVEILQDRIEELTAQLAMVVNI